MTDLTITVANIVPDANATLETFLAGEAITQGKAVYLDPATRKWLLADADSATAAAKAPRGISVNAAQANQPLTVIRKGDLAMGAILTAGDPYYLSSNAGGICPKADVGSGEAVVFLGYAKSTSVLAVDVRPTGVTL